MINFYDSSYWNERSKTYDSLDDIRSKRTAYKIVNVIKSLGLREDPFILDVGCASGFVTRIIRDNFRKSCVVGLDISSGMIDRATRISRERLSFIKGDFLEICWPFHLGNTDLIISSLVLHHLIDGRDKQALDRMYQFLKPNGAIVIAEAVPPDDEIFDYYQDIFRIKEERNCYTKSMLIAKVRSSGFISVRSTTYRFNLRLSNWLNDKTLSLEKKSVLWDMHISASDKFKKAYNMKQMASGDYLLSCKMAIVVGRKSSF